jgi:hypothetical protein
LISHPSDNEESHTYSRSENGRGEKWSVSRLWAAAKGLPVITVRIEDIPDLFNEGSWLRNWHDPTDPMILFEIARVKDADLSFPVILHPDGYLMDGYHRVCKALMAGMTTIEAVKFTPASLPLPDFIWNTQKRA